MEPLTASHDPGLGSATLRVTAGALRPGAQ